METIGSSNGESVVINVVSWLSRGALDAIGHGMIVLLSPRSISFNCTPSQ